VILSPDSDNPSLGPLTFEKDAAGEVRILAALVAVL
jgi:hypothetical protein